MTGIQFYKSFVERIVPLAQDEMFTQMMILWGMAIIMSILTLMLAMVIFSEDEGDIFNRHYKRQMITWSVFGLVTGVVPLWINLTVLRIGYLCVHIIWTSLTCNHLIDDYRRINMLR